MLQNQRIFILSVEEGQYDWVTTTIVAVLIGPNTANMDRLKEEWNETTWVKKGNGRRYRTVSFDAWLIENKGFTSADWAEVEL